VHKRNPQRRFAFVFLASVIVLTALAWLLPWLFRHFVHLLTAGHWYYSVLAWTVAGVIAVVIVGAAGLLVTYLANRPGAGLLLTYSMKNNTSRYTAEELSRLHVDHPQVLIVGLANPRRRDVASAAFDQNRPLVLDVGVPILALARTFAIRLPTYRPVADSPPLPVSVDGTGLRVGPGLISRRLEWRFVIVVDGAAPHLTGQSPLIDVNVRPRKRMRS
jgi:hypothetical protein